MRIFVSPHIDDVVLSAWASLVESPAYVVTCFTADPPEPRSTSRWDEFSNPGLSGSEIMDLRRGEDRMAMELCQAKAIHLDLLEHHYRGEEILNPLSLAACLEPNLDGAEELWLPAGIGGHPDHVLVHTAGRLAAPPNCRIVFYADQPYAASRSRGWPLSVDRQFRTVALELFRLVCLRRSAQRRWNEDLAAGGLPTHSLRRHVVDLTVDEVAMKLRAVHAYRSQAKALGYSQDTVVMSRTLLAHEVYWTA